jgi:4-hydroxybenzoate polyprenyltransferase
MKLTSAFFRLIRWPNLFFIALTQFLFYFFIILPGFHTGNVVQSLNVLHPFLFSLLSLSSVLIAAAGYIINDYFDLNIDRVNRPEKLVVEKHIKRRSTIIWHWVLSGAGLLLGVYVSWKLHNIIILFSHIACIILLWFYSTTFKKKLLIGNIIISVLTAWVILILYVCEFRFTIFRDPLYHQVLSRIFKFAILYAGFAFIISLIREVVKDIEDREGDAKYHCRTMPIVWGINVSKVFIATWLIVLVASLIVVQFYILQNGWWWGVLYCIALIILPLIIILRNLYAAITVADYHRLSSLIKVVMLAGILSMIFF